jgi:RNA polymerase sigma factor
LDHKRREKRWYSLPFSLLKQVESPVDRQADEDLLEILNDMDRKREIEYLQLILADYEISFADLVANSPKHRKTREETRQIALLLAQTEELKQHLCEKKMLPVKHIIELGRFKRKTLERYRKYIIASAIILAGDFPHLQTFVLSREGMEEPPSCRGIKNSPGKML